MVADEASAVGISVLGVARVNLIIHLRDGVIKRFFFLRYLFSFLNSLLGWLLWSCLFLCWLLHRRLLLGWSLLRGWFDLLFWLWLLLRLGFSLGLCFDELLVKSFLDLLLGSFLVHLICLSLEFGIILLLLNESGR